jgi:hypothetical protein
MVFAVLVGCAAMAALLSSYTVQIPSVGQVNTVGLGVYSDAACTQNLTSISWGALDPGSVVNYQVYIKSTSNLPITLTLATDSWNPTTAATYMTLSWNYTSGTEIEPNTSLPVTLTLNVSSSVTGITSFSFNIDMTGTGSG